MITKLLETFNQSKENNNDVPSFNLPINYLDNKYHIEENIKTDLELLPTDNRISLYENIFPVNSIYAKKIIPMWSEYYTANKHFLKDSQYFIKNFNHISQPSIDEINNVHNILEETKNETGFHEKYKYLDNKYFDFLNNSPLFLQILTIYNLTSPIISLAIPILMLIIPFFLLKFQKVSISLKTYIQTLISILKNHVVGKAITEFSHVGWDRRVFIIVSVVFYFINIYQNIISCYTFYKNIYKIKSYLLNINNFLKYSINSITNINKYCKTSHSAFCNINNIVKENLLSFSNEISLIQLDTVNIRQITKIGNILGAFYQLFKNEIYNNSIVYSLYLHGYVENITSLQSNINTKAINFCKFTKSECSFDNAYFASLTTNTPIKNTYKLDKNILITGPNAAGKTTILKTTLFNIIISQQLGIGCYKSAKINPYTHIHSYINIPDTSERDSLFQAEARRCKEILDSIANSHPLERHFCIFDEIYSGTNPSEAIASAYSFLSFITKNKKLDYILTTHYFSLCKMLNNVNRISNKQMEIKDNENTYKLIDGISNVKGGIKVLEDLKYNNEIIISAKKIIETIDI